MKKHTKEFQTRYDTAKRWRDAAKPFIQEILRFTCPGREHDFDRKSISEYETDVFISIGEDLASDLAGDIITYYTPPETKWSDYIVTAEVPEEAAEQVLALVRDREDKMQEAFAASNYYDMAPQWAFEAATHGTPAIWVQKGHIAQPVHFQAVPPHELLITPGYLGHLDRFRETNVPADALKALFDGWEVDLSNQKLQEKYKKPGATCKVCWGFWLDWSDPGNPRWKCEIGVDGNRVTPDAPIDLGPITGSCPLVVGRFNPQAGRPWGRGPGWKALPDLRVLDKVDEVVLSGLDQSLMTTLIYPDDGFLDLSEGIEAGRAYPAQRGFNREQVYDLSRSVNVDQGWFTEERIEDRIRRAFYQDGPRQRGETPPTASQWLDERRRVQQRLGKPSAPLWSEMILPMMQRVEYLLVEAGDLPEAITHDERNLTVMPMSPLQKAQNQDQVMISRANLDLAFNVLGDQVATVVDVVGTLKNVVKASGDELTKVFDQQQAPMQPAGAPDAAAPPPV
jgi:hypothetical protein